MTIELQVFGLVRVTLNAPLVVRVNVRVTVTRRTRVNVNAA